MHKSPQALYKQGYTAHIVGAQFLFKLTHRDFVICYDQFFLGCSFLNCLKLLFPVGERVVAFSKQYCTYLQAILDSILLVTF